MSADEACPFCEIVARRAPATIIDEWSEAMIIDRSTAWTLRTRCCPGRRPKPSRGWPGTTEGVRPHDMVHPEAHRMRRCSPGKSVA